MNDMFGPLRLPMITLWQPWAILCFTGDKLHETRSFRFPKKLTGRTVVIHAAQKRVSIPLDLAHMISGDRTIRFDFGAALGTVRLVSCHRVEDITPTATDRICGDWSPGRYAWQLGDPQLFARPVPFKGKQGWGIISLTGY